MMKRAGVMMVMWVVLMVFPGHGQGVDGNRVPLMRPEEEVVVNRQSDLFNKALEPVLAEAARSTVRVWGSDGRPRMLGYGTVVGDGSEVLAKWSEVEGLVDTLQVQPDGGDSFRAEVVGVFTEEDLVLLGVKGGGGMTAARFYVSELKVGRFLAAPQPSGRPVGFGVVSVLERNLRETDQAHLGILADQEFKGEGVRIASVQPEYGAANAGIQAGDVILKVGERKISGLQELKNALSAKQPGDEVEILIDSAGKEQGVKVVLSNRPMTGQFSGDRLNQMERMGGEPSRVRGGFSRVVQSDMQIQRDRIGGPVVDLEGRVVGITLARADRTRTYLMGSEAVLDLLKSRYDTVAEARAKQAASEQLLAKQERELLPKVRAMGKPQDVQRMRRHVGDLERLMLRMREEMEALEGGR